MASPHNVAIRNPGFVILFHRTTARLTDISSRTARLIESCGISPGRAWLSLPHNKAKPPRIGNTPAITIFHER